MLYMMPGKVAVIPLKDPGKRGSLYLPEKSKRGVDQGIVKYRHEDVEEIKVGDHVYFNSYVGTWVTMEGEGDLIIVPEDFIIAIQGEGPPATHCRECGAYLLRTYDTAPVTDAQLKEGGDNRLEDSLAAKGRIHDRRHLKR